jgi:hypothetical protein
MTLNIKAEVEYYMGRPLTQVETREFRQLRSCGYANPIDISNKLKGK